MINSRRLEISDLLKEVIGNSNTYYKPPENLKLKYPCAVYDLDGVNARRANNKAYLSHNRYIVTFITTDPDNTYYDAMMEHFLYVRFDRSYKADGLYHFVYTVY